MSNSIVSYEGGFFDDNDYFISSYFVDFREREKQVPIRTVIKGCYMKHALESGKTIRIAKPEEFRNSGEGLIRDPEEMILSRTEAESRVNYTSGGKGSSTKTTHTLTFGKNGWIFCTSIEPTCQDEKDKWQKSMSCEYDHFSYIRRPRTFAQSLAGMVAEQLGPRDKEKHLESRFGDLNNNRIGISGQTVFHGPVIYVDDPYEVITRVTSEVESLLLPFFLKRAKFRDQREYRFVIWAEEEPSEASFILDMSLAMLGSLKERLVRPSRQPMIGP